MTILCWTQIDLSTHAYSLSIRIAYACEITEMALMDVIRTINEGITKVHEFTAVLDDRESPETVGFFFEVIEDAIGMVEAVIGSTPLM